MANMDLENDNQFTSIYSPVDYVPVMKNDRIVLHKALEEILGSKHVYFRPPETLKMKYPAIVYDREDIANVFADNTVYGDNIYYSITVIDSDPDSEIVERVSKIPCIRFDRHYISDGLNHDIFVLRIK